MKRTIIQVRTLVLAGTLMLATIAASCADVSVYASRGCAPMAHRAQTGEPLTSALHCTTPHMALRWIGAPRLALPHFRGGVLRIPYLRLPRLRAVASHPFWRFILPRYAPR